MAERGPSNKKIEELSTKTAEAKKTPVLCTQASHTEEMDVDQFEVEILSKEVEDNMVDRFHPALSQKRRKRRR